MPSHLGTIYQRRGAVSIDNAPGDSVLPKRTEIESKLDQLEERANLVIFEARSLRPILSRYKDKITICLNRVTITRASMFSMQEYPMGIENVTGARVSTSFMYATLDIDTFGVSKPEPVRHMRIKDARQARRYILALIECKKANIDLSGLKIEGLKEKLNSIGMVRYTPYQKGYHNL